MKKKSNSKTLEDLLKVIRKDKNYSKFYTDYSDQIKRSFSKEMKFLGNGAYGVVYSFGEKYAVKFAEYSKRVEKFYRIAKKTKNPLFPKIYYIFKRKNFLIIVMERLQSNQKKIYKTYRMFSNLYYGSKIAKNTQKTDLYKKVFPAYKKLLTISSGLDIHTGNFLVRSNGDVVFSDPIY